ncbi:MAG: hypothetical protein K2M59_01540 [Muribaculaceae bacterium]|nr:hypothetical protein [Muribaculaceae bacterium]
MKKTVIALMALVSILGTGCSKKTTAPVTTGSNSTMGPVEMQEKLTINEPARLLIKATAFKMSGPYADNVAVTLNADGTFAYYPAPSDISENSKPIDLGNGWYLNRQGITSNSVFTRYTFGEYAALKNAPSRDELKAAIIPGAKVTEWEQLPYTPSEALSHIPEIKALLAK